MGKTRKKVVSVVLSSLSKQLKCQLELIGIPDKKGVGTLKSQNKTD